MSGTSAWISATNSVPVGGAVRLPQLFTGGFSPLAEKYTPVAVSDKSAWGGSYRSQNKYL